jgi:hypothetical protein
MAKAKQKPVTIEVMRLDYKLAEPGSRRRKFIEAANRALAGGAVHGRENLLTAVRLAQTPMRTLIDNKKIGGEEVRAAEDIMTAFHAIAGGMLIKPISMEKRDRGQPGEHPLPIVEAVRRYQAWARHWAIRAKRGDKVLETIIRTVFFEHPFSVVDADLNMRKGRAAETTAAGLRDYAARVVNAHGRPYWVDPKLSREWIGKAEGIFRNKG